MLIMVADQAGLSFVDSELRVAFDELIGIDLLISHYSIHVGLGHPLVLQFCLRNQLRQVIVFCAEQMLL